MAGRTRKPAYDYDARRAELEELTERLAAALGVDAEDVMIDVAANQVCLRASHARTVAERLEGQA